MFELFEHTADIGIRARASTIEQAFSEAGKALFTVMVNLSQVEAEKEIELWVEADSLENLFINYLNELLYLKDVEEMFFSEFRIEKIEATPAGFELHGKALGEKINALKHDFLTEVKAATYSQVKFEKQENEYLGQCILDV